MMFDQKIEKRIFKYTRKNEWAKYGSIFGARYLIFIGIILLLVFQIQGTCTYGLWIISLSTLFTVWGITALLQFTIGRHRPFEDGMKSLIKPWIKSPSFPSAHSSIAFAVAITGLFTNIYLGVGLLVIAVWIAVSRIAVGVHFLTDVLVGALIGSLIALLFQILLN